MSIEQFIEELEKLEIILTEKQIKQLDQYYQLLIEYNQYMNLTGITEKKEVYLKHFYDCITLKKAVHLEKVETLCDIGSGAGFPGLVLKIMFPNIHIVLIDSLNKRVEFLKTVIQQLDLKGIEAIHIRAEDYAQQNRSKFQIVTSRAVAHLSMLSELSLPLVQKDGYFIPMKANIELDLHTLNSIVSKLNGKVEEIISFDLPIENSIRNLIKIKKIGETSLKYPRKFSDIKKKPLK